MESLKNEETIKIFLRVRPTKNYSNHLRIILINLELNQEKNLTEIIIPKKDKQGIVNNTKERHTFKFDHIFNMETKQSEVFDLVAKDVIDSALDGYNGTIFAYGQTGSGKTYTITGGAERIEDKGIIPRTLNYLFKEINKRNDYQYEVKIAYLEIYNNDGYDLLPESTQAARALEDLPRVRIRENESRQFILTNLKNRKVANEEEALYLLMMGDDNRVVAETPKNDASTRSHCLFMIQIESQKIGEDSKKISKLHIVDLSGSESNICF